MSAWAELHDSRVWGVKPSSKRVECDDRGCRIGGKREIGRSVVAFKTIWIAKKIDQSDVT